MSSTAKRETKLRKIFRKKLIRFKRRRKVKKNNNYAKSHRLQTIKSIVILVFSQGGISLGNKPQAN